MKKLQPTQNELPLEDRQVVCGLLQSRLSDSLDLYAKLKHAHWNVRGANFLEVHELFDKIAEAVEESTDIVAERLRQLGGYANGTVQHTSRRSTLSEYPEEITNSLDHLRAVGAMLAAFGKELRDGIEVSSQAGDPATADIFTQYLREVDKYLWFVESHLG